MPTVSTMLTCDDPEFAFNRHCLILGAMKEDSEQETEKQASKESACDRHHATKIRLSYSSFSVSIMLIPFTWIDTGEATARFR